MPPTKNFLLYYERYVLSLLGSGFNINQPESKNNPDSHKTVLRIRGFFDPGSVTWNNFFPDPRSRIHISDSLIKFLGKKYKTKIIRVLAVKIFFTCSKFTILGYLWLQK
jgi:hypothetical protein